MKDISCSGVQRKRTWWVLLLDLLFTGKVLQDVAQSQVTAEYTVQQLLKLTMLSS